MICVVTTTFLIKRSPSPLLNNKSLFELLYKTRVDYSPFKVFGCLVFASTPLAHRVKFDLRAKICVFIGYLTGMKRHKLYDIQNKQTLISGKWFFHEENFPFHSMTLPEQTFSKLFFPFQHLILHLHHMLQHQLRFLGVLLQPNPPKPITALLSTDPPEQ